MSGGRAGGGAVAHHDAALERGAGRGDGVGRIGVQLEEGLAGGDLVAEVDEQADAGGGLHQVVLAGAAGAEPRHAARPTASASQRSSTPERAARNSSTCDATGRGADGSPPCAAIIASHTRYAPPEASTSRGRHR